eukprot:Skav228756  [mRNA]  locus=scaffold589:114345:118814:+ [translate_table: standard]
MPGAMTVLLGDKVDVTLGKMLSPTTFQCMIAPCNSEGVLHIPEELSEITKKCQSATLLDCHIALLESTVHLTVKKTGDSRILFHPSSDRGPYRAAELFGGLGGWAFAANQWKMTVTVIVEKDEKTARACATAMGTEVLSVEVFCERAIRGQITTPGVVNCDVRQTLLWMGLSILNVGFILASPPCQSWSTVGAGGGLSSPDGEVFVIMLKYAGYTRVLTLLAENVPGIVRHADFGILITGGAMDGMKMDQQLSGIMAGYGSQHKLPVAHLKDKGMFTVLYHDTEGHRYFSPWEIVAALGFPECVVLDENIVIAQRQAGNAISIAHAWLQIAKTHMILGLISPFTQENTLAEMVSLLRQEAIKLSGKIIYNEGGFSRIMNAPRPTQVASEASSADGQAEKRQKTEQIPATIPFHVDQDLGYTKAVDPAPTFVSHELSKTNGPQPFAKGGLMFLQHFHANWMSVAHGQNHDVVSVLIQRALPHAKKNHFRTLQGPEGNVEWDDLVSCVPPFRLIFQPETFQVSCVLPDERILMVADVTWTVETVLAYVASTMKCQVPALALTNGDLPTRACDFLAEYERQEYKVGFKLTMPGYVSFAVPEQMVAPQTKPVAADECRFVATHPSMKIKHVLGQRGVSSDDTQSRTDAFLAKCDSETLLKAVNTDDITFWAEMKQEANRVKFRLVCRTELTSHKQEGRQKPPSKTKGGRKAQKAQKSFVANPSNIKIDMAHFMDGESQVELLDPQRFGPDQSGLAVMNCKDADRHSSNQGCLSMDALAILVVGRVFQEDDTVFSMPAYNSNGDPIVIQAALRQFGDRPVTFRAAVHGRGDPYLQERSGEMGRLLGPTPLLGRSRVRGAWVVRLAGIYLSPKTADRRHDERYSVIIMPECSLSEAQKRASAHDKALGIVKIKEQYAVRCKREHAMALRASLLPESAFVAMEAVSSDEQLWLLKHVPNEIGKAGLQQALTAAEWNARPVRAQGLDRWVVASNALPPCRHLCINNAFVLVEPFKRQHEGPAVTMVAKQFKVETLVKAPPSGQMQVATTSRYQEMNADLSEHMEQKLADAATKIDYLAHQLQVMQAEHNQEISNTKAELALVRDEQAFAKQKLQEVESSVVQSSQSVISTMQSMFTQMQSTLEQSMKQSIETSMQAFAGDPDENKRARVGDVPRTDVFSTKS